MTSALYKPLSLSVRFLLLPSVAFWGGLLFHLSRLQKERHWRHTGKSLWLLFSFGSSIFLYRKYKINTRLNVWRLKCVLTTLIKPETPSYVH